VQKNGTTLAELTEKHSLVLPDQVSIGSDGSVQIANAKLAASVHGMLAKASRDDGFFDTNCSCRASGGTTTASAAASW